MLPHGRFRGSGVRGTGKLRSFLATLAHATRDFDCVGPLVALP